MRVTLKTSGVLSYLLSDGLSSMTVVLSSIGSTQAVQLFAPYGSVRSSHGTMQSKSMPQLVPITNVERGDDHENLAQKEHGEVDPSVTSVIPVISLQRQVDVFRGRPPLPHAYQRSRNSA
jgi:hypothetical protein